MRFAFRQVDHRDLPQFFADGEIRAKNHAMPQQCHQTSYHNLVSMRGQANFQLPHGGVVNDYVAFYFSPVTSFTYTIHRGNVSVIAPDGSNLGASSAGQRVFFVVDVARISNCGIPACYSNYALNSQAPMPVVTGNFASLEQHVLWSLFDEAPMTAQIPEIGYGGVCCYFQSRDIPAHHQRRSPARMAELLVRNAIPMSLVAAIVTPTEHVRVDVARLAARHGYQGVVVCKPACFL